MLIGREWLAVLRFQPIPYFGHGCIGHLWIVAQFALSFARIIVVVENPHADAGTVDISFGDGKIAVKPVDGRSDPGDAFAQGKDVFGATCNAPHPFPEFSIADVFSGQDISFARLATLDGVDASPGHLSCVA